MATYIAASPRSTLVDENVVIKVGGLKPGQKVTLKSSAVTECEDSYDCIAYYQADESGDVDLVTYASKGGSYSGVEPMGLFWALKESDLNQRRCTRLVKKDVQTPLVVQIEVHAEWLSIKDTRKNKPMASISVERWYISKDVERHVVNVGRIRGVIFVPKTDKKLNGIIDLFGIAGGLMEFRASMLASRGFLVLALAIYGYKDLPELLPFIDLDYFEEGVNFLSSHPKCAGGGVGVIGTSMGGTIATAMATYVPKVTRAIVVNGPIYSTVMDIKYRGFTLKSLETNLLNVKYIEELDMYDFKYYSKYPEKAKDLKKGLIEFPKSEASFLFFFSLSDGVMPNREFKRRIKKFVEGGCGVGTYEMVMYPGAGHLLELPNTPLCRGIYLKPLRGNAFYGGETKPHSKAQYDSWKRTLEFFEQKMNLRSSL